METGRVSFIAGCAIVKRWVCGAGRRSMLPGTPPIEQLVTEIAAEGVLVSGTLIQAFNASKRQPEIIRASQIYVGEEKPREFIIYRSEREYDHVLNPPALVTSCDCNPPPFKVGHIFDRLVLVPAKAQDALANGRWKFSNFGGSVAGGRSLRLLAEEANRFHRLQSLPPKDGQWGD